MSFRVVLFLAALVGTVTTAPTQQECATCPSLDNGGNVLVAASGGTLGVPKFCG